MSLSFLYLFILSVLLSSPAAANPPLHPPHEDNDWPILVFAAADSFSARYDRFFRAHFDTVFVENLPSWLELDRAALSRGEHVLTRLVTVQDNQVEILDKLQEFVSGNDEIGMTQFSPEPDFPSEYFVLGHREGSLTLVPYNAMGVRDTLVDLEAVGYLAGRGAFMAAEEDGESIIVIGRGDITEVDMWHPILAREVLHTHTIPGNINPTGYLEFSEGSDRDLIITSHKFQDPIRKFRSTQQN